MLGAIRLSKLKALDIDRLYTKLRTRGLAPATIRQIHAILRRWLTDPVTREGSARRCRQPDVVTSSGSNPVSGSRPCLTANRPASARLDTSILA